MALAPPILRSFRSDEISAAGSVVGREGLFGGRSGLRIGSWGSTAYVASKGVTGVHGAALSQDRSGRTTLSGRGPVHVAGDGMTVEGTFTAGAMPRINDVSSATVVEVARPDDPGVVFFRTSGTDRAAIDASGHLVVGPVGAGGAASGSADLSESVLTVNGSATVRGSLVVQGETTQVAQQSQFSDRLVINNYGLDQAFVVAQSGTNSVARFVDVNGLGSAAPLVQKTTGATQETDVGSGATFVRYDYPVDSGTGAPVPADGFVDDAGIDFYLNLTGVTAMFKDDADHEVDVTLTLANDATQVVTLTSNASDYPNGILSETAARLIPTRQLAKAVEVRQFFRDPVTTERTPVPIDLGSTADGSLAAGSVRTTLGVGRTPLAALEVRDGGSSVFQSNSAAGGLTVVQHNAAGALASLAFQHPVDGPLEALGVDALGQTTLTSRGETTALTVAASGSAAGVLADMRMLWTDGSDDWSSRFTFARSLTGTAHTEGHSVSIKNTMSGGGMLRLRSEYSPGFFTEASVGPDADLVLRNQSGTTAAAVTVENHSSAPFLDLVDSTTGTPTSTLRVERVGTLVTASGFAGAPGAGDGAVGAGGAVLRLINSDDTNRGALQVRASPAGSNVFSVDNEGVTVISSSTHSATLLQVNGTSASAAAEITSAFGGASSHLRVSHAGLLARTNVSGGVQVDNDLGSAATLLRATASGSARLTVESDGFTSLQTSAGFDLVGRPAVLKITASDGAETDYDVPLVSAAGSKVSFLVGAAATGAALESEGVGYSVTKKLDQAQSFAAGNILDVRKDSWDGEALTQVPVMAVGTSTTTFTDDAANSSSVVVHKSAVDDATRAAALVVRAAGHALEVRDGSDATVLLSTGGGKTYLGAYTYDLTTITPGTLSTETILSVNGNATVLGDLVVQGTTTTMNTDVRVSEQLLVMNATEEVCTTIANKSTDVNCFQIYSQDVGGLEAFSAPLSGILSDGSPDPATAESYYQSLSISGLGACRLQSLAADVGLDVRAYEAADLLRVNSRASTDFLVAKSELSLNVRASPAASATGVVHVRQLAGPADAGAGVPAVAVASRTAAAVRVSDFDTPSAELFSVSSRGDVSARDAAVDNLSVRNLHDDTVAARFGNSGNVVYTTPGAALTAASTLAPTATTLTYVFSANSQDTAYLDLTKLVATVTTGGTTVTTSITHATGTAVDTSFSVAAGPLSATGVVPLATLLTGVTQVVLTFEAGALDAGTVQDLAALRLLARLTTALRVVGSEVSAPVMQVDSTIGANTANLVDVRSEGTVRFHGNGIDLDGALDQEVAVRAIDTARANASSVTASTLVANAKVESVDGAFTGHVDVTGFTEVDYPEVFGGPSEYSVTATYDVAARAFSSTSDMRLKKDIRDVDAADATEIVRGLRPKTYMWKDGSDGRVHTGFISQELMEEGRTQFLVVPAPHEGLEACGDIPANVKLTVNYIEMIPLLTSALQTALARIDELEAKVAALSPM